MRAALAALLLTGMLVSGSTEAIAAQPARDFVREFPSAESTVMASPGFINRKEIGYFHGGGGDVQLVTQRFRGPSSLTGVALRIWVLENTLYGENHVTWALEVNGLVVGGV